MENKIVFIPVSEEYFFEKIRAIIKEEISAKERQDFQEKLISASEACKIFNPAISKVTLHRWTEDKVLPVHRIGGRIYYKHSEVIEAAKRVKKYDRH